MSETTIFTPPAKKRLSTAEKLAIVKKSYEQEC